MAKKTKTAEPQILHKARIRETRLMVIVLIATLLLTEPMAGWNEPALLTFRILGQLLIVIGVMGRTFCSAFVGGKKNVDVIQEGPFSIVRNPLYVFSFIGLVGIGFQTGRFTILAILVYVFAKYYRLIVEKEEVFLHGKFGKAYETYCARVPRWLPNFKLWSLPPTVEVNPVFLYRTMRDGFWFFMVWPLLEIIHHFQYISNFILLPLP